MNWGITLDRLNTKLDMVLRAPKHAYSPGLHSLFDFRGLENKGSAETIETVLRQAAADCGATVLSVHVHTFGNGESYTAVALLSESHISVHTWPEHNLAAVDAFMCGGLDASRVEAAFTAYFKPKSVVRTVIDRCAKPEIQGQQNVE